MSLKRLSWGGGLVLTFLLNSAAYAQTTFSFGPWSLSVPAGAKQSQQGELRAFEAGGINYVFTPAQAINGKTLELIAQATISELSGGKGRANKTDEGTENGREYRTYVLVLAETATSAQVYLLHFIRHGSQWGLALANYRAAEATNAALLKTALTTLNTTEFTVSGASPQVANTSPPKLTTPALAAVPWPTPRSDRTALSKLALDYPAALKRGINPTLTLLPDTFECYQQGQDSVGGPRAMTPTPDLRVIISQNGKYTLTTGRDKSQGQWSVRGQDLSFSGPLSLDKGYFRADDAGQVFDVWYSKNKYTCFQAGPAADAYRIQLLRGSLRNETFSCRDANGQKFPLTFKDNTYSTPSGSGPIQKAFRDTDGLVEFIGGPLGASVGTIGKVAEDQFGYRQLEISVTTTTKGAFSLSSQKAVLASCSAQSTPKPLPLYGQAKAPASAVKGGPSGLFTVSKGGMAYMGGAPGMEFQYQYQVVLAYFNAQGYYLEDVDLSDLGSLPDCTRTKPNGLPFCDRYDLKGKQIRFPNSDQSWDSFSPFQVTKEGFEAGDSAYVGLTPLNGQLNGLYSESSTTSFGGASTGVGTYLNRYSGYSFAPGGAFEWMSSSASTTLMSATPTTSGVVGGASSGQQNSGKGTYSLKDNWLTLKFSDGRVKRLFVFAIGDDYLNIDGDVLPKQKGKK